jgi:hypothetical protein
VKRDVARIYDALAAHRYLKISHIDVCAAQARKEKAAIPSMPDQHGIHAAEV